MAIEPKLIAAYKDAFLPYAAIATDRVHAMGCRFAYYSTASTALQMLRGREIWMRNTMVMNDFSEVEHGLSCVIKAYRSDAGARLKGVLEEEYAGISAEFEELFNSWIPGFRRDTFVACLSEHPPEEDLHGRLSMWRAYGGAAGVALVVNGDVLFRPSNALAAYSSPVAYLNEGALDHELDAVATALTQKRDLLKQLGRDGTKHAIFHMLRFAAVCTKHPAFAEEREWRVVASPALESSPLLPVELETIGGIPQKVLKIKLMNHPDEGLTGLEPKELIERVLIGPCEHAEVIGQAIWQALETAGVPDAGQKIVYTGIPLRENQR
jgi:hypothetical protein